MYRIKALKDFCDVKAGDIGGYVESKDNLSQEGNCWIFGDAIVKGKAKVLDNATAIGNAQVLDHAIIKDYAIVSDYATVTDHSKVYDHSIVVGCARINGTSEVHGYAIVGGNADVTYANIYNYAKVTDGVRIGATINGDTVINIHGCLKNNAYISSINDYINIIMNGITVTFYLSKDKDIYFTFGGHEYKLGNLNSYTEELNDIIGFPMIIELAKKYLLKEREENE